MKLYHRLLIIAVFLTLGGIIMIVAGLLPPPALVDSDTLAYEDFTGEDSYYIQDLAVVWEYGSIGGNDDESGAYYLSYFFDEKGALCTASLFFDNSEEWRSASEVHDYSETDMMMGGCFHSQKLLSFDKDMKRYYEDTLEEFRSISGDYLGITDINDTGLHLKFVCNEKQDYASAGKRTDSLTGGLIMTGLAIVLFLISLPLMKKDKADAARIQMTQPRFDPYTGAPIQPQAPYGAPQGYPYQTPYGGQQTYPNQPPYGTQPYPNQYPYGTQQGYPTAPTTTEPQTQASGEEQKPYQGPEF